MRSFSGTLPGRFIAVGLLGVLALLAWFAVVEPYRDYRERQQGRLLEVAELTARYESAAAARGVASSELETAQQASLSAMALLSGDNAALMAGELQQRLKAILGEAGTSSLGTESLPPEREGAFEWIGVGLRFTATMDQLQRVLYEIETQRPFLVVRELAVLRPEMRRRIRQGGRGEPAEADQERFVPAELAVTLQVFGLAHRAEEG